LLVVDGSFHISVFLAHDDIRVSASWRKEILKSLRRCEIFVPILTEAFAKSNWTDQEAGYALGRGALIAPLKVDVDPYGFIGEFHARRLKSNSVVETCWAVLESLKNDSRLGEKIKEAGINVFLLSGTFDDAYENLKKLMKLAPFDSAQTTTLFKEGSRNQNIYGSFKVRPLMQGILKDARGKVSGTIISKYKRAVASWG